MNIKDVSKAIHCPSMLDTYPELKTVKPEELVALLKMHGRYEQMTFKNVKLFAAGVVLGLRLAQGRL